MSFIGELVVTNINETIAYNTQNDTMISLFTEIITNIILFKHREVSIVSFLTNFF